VKLPNGKADTVAECFTKIFKRFESQMRLSMTFDQGSEMSKRGCKSFCVNDLR